jgi:hypothetical protein
MRYPRQIKRIYHRVAGQVVAAVLRPGAAYDPRNFELWQRRGYHILPLTFYSPIPDTRSLETDGAWAHQQETLGIDWNVACQTAHLKDLLAPYGEEFTKNLSEGNLNELGFRLPNDAFVGIDPASLYAMLRHYRPKQVVEIGSGHSTRVMMAALLQNGSGELVSVDPYQDAQLFRDLSSTGYHVVEKRVEQLPAGFFDRLRAGDVLFIDSSHTVRTGGDVTYLFLEVLPRLKAGVLVHFHDIFMPDEYPRHYFVNELCFWAEQYLLHGFLLFNSTFEIVLANHYLSAKYQSLLRQCFPRAPWYDGCSFWIRRMFPTEEPDIPG